MMVNNLDEFVIRLRGNYTFKPYATSETWQQAQKNMSHEAREEIARHYPELLSMDAKPRRIAQIINLYANKVATKLIIKLRNEDVMVPLWLAPFLTTDFKLMKAETPPTFKEMLAIWNTRALMHRSKFYRTVQMQQNQKGRKLTDEEMRELFYATYPFTLHRLRTGMLADMKELKLSENLAPLHNQLAVLGAVNPVQFVKDLDVRMSAMAVFSLAEKLVNEDKHQEIKKLIKVLRAMYQRIEDYVGPIYPEDSVNRVSVKWVLDEIATYENRMKKEVFITITPAPAIITDKELSALLTKKKEPYMAEPEVVNLEELPKTITLHKDEAPTEAPPDPVPTLDPSLAAMGYYRGLDGKVHSILDSD